MHVVDTTSVGFLKFKKKGSLPFIRKKEFSIFLKSNYTSANNDAEERLSMPMDD